MFPALRYMLVTFVYVNTRFNKLIRNSGAYIMAGFPYITQPDHFLPPLFTSYDFFQIMNTIKENKNTYLI